MRRCSAAQPPARAGTGPPPMARKPGRPIAPAGPHGRRQTPPAGAATEAPPAASLGLARARARGGDPDPRFEYGEYLEQVAAIFAAIDRPYVARIDASGSAEAVTARALAALRTRIDLG